MFTYEELATLRDSFIAIASHKVLTPLTVIRYQSENILKDSQISPDLKEKVEVIKINADKLNDFAQTLFYILEVDQYRSEKDFLIENRQIKLKEAVENTFNDFMDELKRKDCVIKVISDSENITEFGFQTKYFLEIVRHLVSNAVLYSDKSSEIRISIKDANGELVLSVENNCQELDDNDIKFMAEPFWRSTGAVKSGIAGNGLGLYFVKLFAARVKGRLEITKKSDKLIVSILVPSSNKK